MSKRGRLDQFIAKRLQVSKKAVRQWVINHAVQVDGKDAYGVDQQIDEFSHIVCNGEVLQQFVRQYYLLHKPKGVVSATKDDIHATALSLLGLSTEQQAMMHIAGRLDLQSSGLLLITNDAKWSAALMSPQHKVAKQYLVTVANPLDDNYAPAFAKGMYFDYEGVTTLPAQLTVVSDYQAIVSLHEGKYHQIKRMFGRFRNPVIELHRFAIGDITLGALKQGEYRALTTAEIAIVSGY
nr:16S rRNA pseudouridine(516) synthase [Shewanella intestini]